MAALPGFPVIYTFRLSSLILILPGNKSTISPKYQDAQNEYVLALNDYNSAGKSLIAMADGLTYPASGDAFENFYKRSDSGERHLKKAIALFPMNDPPV